MRSFTHHNARSIKEAIELLTRYNGKAKLNAGGTDLLGVLKERSLFESPEALINLKTIPGYDYIKEDRTGLKIGALTTLSEIAGSSTIKAHYKILAEAAQSVATPQIRNMCTISGNLAQDVRCWYYRYPQQIGGPIFCLRKGGKICNALAGDNRYHSIFGAAPLADYPCSSHCPAHTDMPAYLSRVRNADLTGAARIVLDANPIPAITGRVCPIFCEPECSRSAFDEPVAIRCVERAVGDYTLENKDEFFAPPQCTSNKSIAVIGSGPAGLAAAYYLRRSGHQVTVYEKQPEAGGMLCYSIPPYRLPKDVVREQIQALEEMGIQFKLGVTVGKDVALKALMGKFNAVFLAGGAWKERSLGIKGERIALSGLQFLNKVNTGARDIPGKKVAVVGGGNVALDVARTLLRLGAKPVVLYRRTQKEMPASREEIEKAKEEGIRFRFLTVPTEAAKTNSKISLTCVRMKLGAPDASGRPQPIPKPGSDFTLTFDAVIKAIGEEPDTSLLSAEFKKKGRNATSPALLIGKNLFAGGDFVTGPSTVIQAVAAGREAASLIERSFNGRQPAVQEDAAAPEFSDAFFESVPRLQIPEVPVSERVKGIDVEDLPGISVNEIQTEARRCFNCGCLAVGPSDTAIALIALDAKIVTTKRTVDAQHFFRASATGSTVLDPDEVITEIQIPKPQESSRQTYSKFTLRRPVDFAIVSVASVLTMDDGICKDARIVLGAVAPTPLRALAAEDAIRGKSLDATVAEEAAEAALSNAKPLSMNEYKVVIAKTLVKRALLASTKR